MVVYVEPVLPTTSPLGVAITHGLMSSGNSAEQLPCGGLDAAMSVPTFVQAIPAGELVTTPVPVPAKVTVSVHVPVDCADRSCAAFALDTAKTKRAPTAIERATYLRVPITVA